MIPPSSMTEVSVDSMDKEKEVESTEQPPSPASTNSQESKVLEELDVFFSFLFFLTLPLFWKEMCCFDFYLQLFARISSRVLWATSDCGACSDTPTSDFWILPVTWEAQGSELEKHLPFEMFVSAEFGLYFSPPYYSNDLGRVMGIRVGIDANRWF